MILFYSGVDSKYGEPVDTEVFTKDVMMTFDKLQGNCESHRFWEIVQSRRKRPNVSSVEKKKRGDRNQ